MSQDMAATQMSINKWTKKMWYVCMYVYTHACINTHTHNRILLYSVIIKNEILSFIAIYWHSVIHGVAKSQTRLDD